MASVVQANPLRGSAASAVQASSPRSHSAAPAGSKPHQLKAFARRALLWGSIGVVVLTSALAILLSVVEDPNVIYIVYISFTVPRALAYMYMSSVLHRRWWQPYLNVDLLFVLVVGSAVAYGFLTEFNTGINPAIRASAIVAYPILLICTAGHFRAMIKWFPWTQETSKLYKYAWVVAAGVFILSEVVGHAAHVAHEMAHAGGHEGESGAPAEHGEPEGRVLASTGAAAARLLSEPAPSPAEAFVPKDNGMFALFVTVTLHFYLDALHLALENCHHVKHAAADGHAHHHSGEAEHVVVMDGRGGGPGTSAEMSDILGDSTETWG